ncbi:MAG: hypothetical protein IPL91_11325 [Hyphomicrobium sp.]|nr:hypothetical protein [Hyphomicrobium sp.]
MTSTTSRVRWLSCVVNTSIADLSSRSATEVLHLRRDQVRPAASPEDLGCGVAPRTSASSRTMSASKLLDLFLRFAERRTRLCRIDLQQHIAGATVAPSRTETSRTIPPSRFLNNLQLARRNNAALSCRHLVDACERRPDEKPDHQRDQTEQKPV